MANDTPRVTTRIAHELARRTKPLPESWTKAAGLLRGKKKALTQHLQRVRKEWDDRSTRS